MAASSANLWFVPWKTLGTSKAFIESGQERRERPLEEPRITLELASNPQQQHLCWRGLITARRPRLLACYQAGILVLSRGIKCVLLLSSVSPPKGVGSYLHPDSGLRLHLGPIKCSCLRKVGVIKGDQPMRRHENSGPWRITACSSAAMSEVKNASEVMCMSGMSSVSMLLLISVVADIPRCS